MNRVFDSPPGLLEEGPPGASPGAAGWELSVGSPDQPTAQGLLQLADPLLERGTDRALRVLERTEMVAHAHRVHSAGPTYGNPWIRDAFAWGMVPSLVLPTLATYPGDELAFWLSRQGLLDRCWRTDPKSGWFDETPILISAVLDAYRVRGDRRLLDRAYLRLVRAWEALAAQGRRPAEGSRRLLFCALAAWRFPLSTDWADQVARRNYPAHLQALWYRATADLSAIAGLVGDGRGMGRFSAEAEAIREDIQRLLWCHGRPPARNAPEVPATGYFRAWTGGGDYFETDSNLAMVLYGVADRDQAAQILAFVEADGLLGKEGGPAGAKVVYGDYDPADYLPNPCFRYYMGDDRYHNAYWPSLGGLACQALARLGRGDLVRSLLRGIAARMDDGDGLYEWYGSDGRPGGSRWFQWGARMFLVGLFRGYLGIVPGSDPEALRLEPCFPGTARIHHLGLRVLVRITGHGRLEALAVDGVPMSDPEIPGSMLRDGSEIEARLS